RADPRAVGAVAKQHVAIVRAAHELGEGIDIGSRVMLLCRARERRADDIARGRQVIDAQGANLQDMQEVVGCGGTEHRRLSKKGTRDIYGRNTTKREAPVAPLLLLALRLRV